MQFDSHEKKRGAGFLLPINAVRKHLRAFVPSCELALFNILLAFLFFGLPVMAKEISSEENNYAITIPDDWQVKSQNSSGFLVGSEDGKRTIELSVKKWRYSSTLNSNFIAYFELALSNSVSSVTNRWFLIGSVPACEIVLSPQKNPANDFLMFHLSIADNKLYSLEAPCTENDLLSDSEISQCMASFRFLHEPMNEKAPVAMTPLLDPSGVKKFNKFKPYLWGAITFIIVSLISSYIKNNY